MENTETKLTEKEALHIGDVISSLLFRAEKVYGDKYDRFSIQIEAGEAHLIGHDFISYEPDWEHKLCNVSELLNGIQLNCV
jgi:hypothetical protein